jgi:UDP:flavonoid glycosyltransferase YjiC (YdhE family)
MVCWPVFADQFTVCKYVCEVWGVGRRLDAEVRREQVAARVGEVMESEEVRSSAARWKAVAEEAAGAGGSSHENLLGAVAALGSARSTPPRHEEIGWEECVCVVFEGLLR